MAPQDPGFPTKKRKRNDTAASEQAPPAEGGGVGRQRTAEENTGAADPQPRGGSARWLPHRFPDSEYGDHFETCATAFQDIVRLLKKYAKLTGCTKSTLRIYDPYYCAGASKTHLNDLGFASVIHEPRDFYGDIAAGTVPEFDVLLTNPPFSGDHKERVLKFCCERATAWALLLPGYVATKSYYSAAIGTTQQRPFYLVPKTRYDFAHPEGTGKPSSPFHSFWYLWFGPHTDTLFAWVQRRLLPQLKALARDPQQLLHWRLVPPPRLNPQRQRQLLEGASASRPPHRPHSSPTPDPKTESLSDPSVL
eukprot:TRINITY_DN10705_c0_g1_i1.p1 TRINITY_DN10705_c0_g1~~TRINITY_DN10705_c0_g1_i1.p1  ORF type:complete len:321 (+),score=44.23 TRINITY_DN10705_c0_g1_i1:45-965(+)